MGRSTEPGESDAPPPPAIRSHDDAELRKRIGPVRRYDDDFSSPTPHRPATSGRL